MTTDQTDPGTLSRVRRVAAWGAATTRRIGGRIRRFTRWEWGLVVLIAVYVAVLTSMSLRAHHALATSTYDFALYDQGVWLLSRFKAPFVTLMGRNLFGDHTSFVMFFMVPIYWVFPDAGALLFVQSLAIACGAIPIFLYARHRLESEPVALLLAGTYLLHPAVSWTNMEQFHPDAFFGVFVGFAIYGALTRRWRLYTVFVVLTLLVKEDASLIVIALGLWVIWRRSVLIGVLTVLWSFGFAVFATVLLMQYLTGHATLNAWRIPFGGAGGLVKAMLTRPGDVLDYLRADGRPWWAWQMTAPFGWVFLRLPDVAAIGSLVLIANVVSTFLYQHQIQFHYSLVVVPALALGTVHALGAIKDRRAWFVGGVAVLALWTGFLWSTLPFARDPKAFREANDPFVVAAKEVLPLVPDGAVVAADSSLTPHLAHRRQIYMFPNPFSSFLYGVPGRPAEGTRLPAADDVEYVVLRVPVPEGLLSEAWAQVEGDFVLVHQNDHWAVYRRPELP